MVHSSNKTSVTKNASPAKKKVAAKHSSSPSSSGSGRGSSSSKGPTLTQQILDNTNFLMVTTGEECVPRKKVVSRCGLPSDTGSFKNAITTLKKKQYIEVDKDTIRLTEMGREKAKSIDMAKSNEEQLELAKKCIKGAKGKKMLDILSDGKAHSRVVVAEKLGSDPTKPSWKNFLSAVKKEDCLEYCQDEDGDAALRLPKWILPFSD